MRAPGLSIQHVQNIRSLATIRGDIAALLGYAPKGPRGYPVRLDSWRDFVDIFGEPYGFGHLGVAVKGFFENGGRTCYGVRVTDSSVEPAQLTLQGRVSEGADPSIAEAVKWIFTPAFKQDTANALDRKILDILDVPSPPLNGPLVQDNPGLWGNELALNLDDSRRAVTELLAGAHSGPTSLVSSLDGLEANSFVRLSQPGNPHMKAPLLLRIQAVDPVRSQVLWPTPLKEVALAHEATKELNLDQPIILETIDFTLELWLADQLLEELPHLSLHPDHSRYLISTINQESQWLRVEQFMDPKASEVLGPNAVPRPDQTEFWPETVSLARFQGGRDGLSQVSGSHFLQALEGLEPISEIALLAAPDLLLQAETEQQPPPPVVVETLDCDRLEPPPRGAIRGRVVNASSRGEEPVSQVQVFASNGRRATTDRQGRFTLDQLPLAVISLWFQRRGFVTTEVLAQATTATSRDTATFYLEERQLPPNQSREDVYRVQSAMLNQGEKGLYRIALLDAPEPQLDIQSIQNWRARFDSAYGALSYPWLTVEQDQGLRATPPCGHIAGIYALAERDHGIHRAPANFPLHACKGLTRVLDETQHGILNRKGINAIRLLPGRGIRPFGARSLASAPQWRFISVRRLVNTLEQILDQQLQWVVFEPNSVALREAVRFMLQNLLSRLWRQGALAGDTQEQAFAVKVEGDNNPPHRRDQGQFLAEIQVAPSIPFEFITLRLGRTLDALDIQETA